nr:hypothetical protein BaRGS_017808 [Batillaria attramentaria]
MVCLTGPPGTGKTLLLVLKGLRWLRQGHDVHVVCVFLRSLVACLLIYHQLRRTLLQDPTTPATAGTVHFHQFDLSKGEDSLRAALNTLTSSARNGHLYVIMDEANPFAWDVHGCRRRLIEELSASVPELSLWTASIYRVGIPTCLKEERLTVPLRCAPAIHRELDALIRMQTNVIDVYSRSGAPSPSDGPKVIRFRDVFVLAHNSNVLSDYIKDTENPSSQGSDFVQALRSAGIPVCVFGKKEEDTDTLVKRSGDVAVARDDVTMVTHYDAVTGLERKLVVYLQGRVQGSLAEIIDRACAMGRCTTQLVMVELPQPSELIMQDFDLD